MQGWWTVYRRSHQRSTSALSQRMWWRHWVRIRMWVEHVDFMNCCDSWTRISENSEDLAGSSGIIVYLLLPSLIASSQFTSISSFTGRQAHRWRPRRDEAEEASDGDGDEGEAVESPGHADGKEGRGQGEYFFFFTFFSLHTHNWQYAIVQLHVIQ